MLSRHHPFPTAFLFPRSIPRSALFHTTSPWRSEVVNHYQTLGLDTSASAGAIKKQFYQLSKTHHPDHNPNDPQASDRFVKISEAYAVLGSTQKRGRYDLDLQRSGAGPSPSAQRGSHSSATTPWGSRPPSGLSRRRSQFRGPPPSFYRSGGWGSQAGKRSAQAGASGSAGPAGGQRGGGLGPGQSEAAFGNDVPHFDREGHSRTQEQQDRRRKRRIEQGSVDFSEGGSFFVQSALISAVVAFALSIPWLFESTTSRHKRKESPS